MINAKEIASKLIGEEFVWFICWQSCGGAQGYAFCKGCRGPYLKAKDMDFLRGNVWIWPIWTIKKIEITILNGKINYFYGHFLWHT